MRNRDFGHEPSHSTRAAFAAIPTAVSVDDMRDILDIEGPVRLPFDWTPVWWALAGAAALSVAVWLYLRWRRRRAERLAGDRTPPLSPFEIFERELAALSGLGPSREREFSFRLSAGLRGLLEAAAGVNALEMTTEELEPRLYAVKALRGEAGLRRALMETLSRADMVKFAGSGGDAARMRADLDLAARILTLLRPAPEQPEQPEGSEESGNAQTGPEAGGGR